MRIYIVADEKIKPFTDYFVNKTARFYGKTTIVPRYGPTFWHSILRQIEIDGVETGRVVVCHSDAFITDEGFLSIQASLNEEFSLLCWGVYKDYLHEGKYKNLYETWFDLFACVVDVEILKNSKRYLTSCNLTNDYIISSFSLFAEGVYYKRQPDLIFHKPNFYRFEKFGIPDNKLLPRRKRLKILNIVYLFLDKNYFLYVWRNLKYSLFLLKSKNRTI